MENDKWQTETGDDQVTCHSLVIGGVLCRWWGEVEPEGARLLSAAPELLEALKDLLDREWKGEWQDSKGIDALEAARVNAKTAIAKAEGRDA